MTIFCTPYNALIAELVEITDKVANLNKRKKEIEAELSSASAGELKDRLTGRGTETREVIDARLARAVEESKCIDQYEYIVCNENGKIGECVDEIHHIVECRSRLVKNQKGFIAGLREELAGLRE